jgi:hypothetical protein
VNLPPITAPDGRRAWALVALWGAAAVFTVFAAVGVYLNRSNEENSFYLALAAHAQVLAALSAIGALLVKRTIRAGKDGVEISDQGDAK